MAITKDAVLYYRVSTSSVEQDTSYIAQSNYKSSDYNIVRKYGDKGTGTQVLNRKQFCEMILECGVDIKEVEGQILFIPSSEREAKYNTILVSHTSRFMRNQLLMKSLLRALTIKEVEVIFLDMGRSSLDKDIDFVLNILFLLDEQESRNTSQKVHTGLRKAREQRQYLHIGNGKIFGFDYIKSENKLVKNKEEAPIIKQIFYSYAEEGKSTRQIAKEVNLTPSRVLEILKNERYAGWNGYGKYTVNKLDNINVKNKEYDIFPTDRIEAIISKEIWDKCQEIRKSRSVRNRGIKNNTYPLSSKIVCNVCGKKFYHKGSNKKGDLWECSSKKNNGSCDSVCVNEDAIKKFLVSDKGIEYYISTIEQLIDVVLSNYETKDKAALEKELEEIGKKENKLIDLYMEALIAKDEYSNRLNGFKKQKEILESEIANINNFNKYYEDTIKLKESYIGILNNYLSMINGDKVQEVFKEVREIQIGRVYDKEKEKIESEVAGFSFKGFEALHKLIEDIKFNDTGKFKK